ncbi:PH domain-containing protein [Natronomonas salina]|uniref:PH domain-containing protein n=1 Tax=Natronomonas salina TaxID=1710540 RepID=UPI0015B59807|nr:PH domain-containing protein [Natronomonas salina]QLD89062.1 PH domain-containing protein [Natronomonas salina]
MRQVPDWVTLTDGEKIVWSGGPSPVVIASSLLGEAVLVVVGLIIAGIGPGLVDGGTFPGAGALPGGIRFVGLIIALAGILAGLWTYLRFQSVEYVITSDELYVKRGMLSRSVTNLRLDRIQDSGFNQSASQRLLGYGDVYVSTAGSGGAELVFRNVNDPARVNNAITEQLDAARSPGTTSAPSVDNSSRRR